MDALIILAYLLFLLAVGIYFKANPNSLRKYSHVQKPIRTNRLILAATIFAGSVGGGTTFGLTEKILVSNLAYSYALIITMIVDILVAIYLVPHIAKYHGAISIGDIFEENYGRLGRIMAGIGVVISSVGFLAAQITVSSYLLSGVFAIGKNIAVALSYLIIIVYSTIGGLRSIIVNNFLQFCSMIIGVVLFSYFALNHIHFGEFISSIPAEKYDLTTGSLFYDTIFLAMNFSIVICYPTFIQRATLNKDSRFMKDAVIVKSLIYVFFIIAISFNALIVEYLSPHPNTAIALLQSIKQIVPIGISGFVIIGFLSAAMSTADSDLNIASISISRDILMPIFDIKNSRNLVIIAQIATFVIGLLSIYISLLFTNIVDIILSVAILWAPWLLVPFIASLFGIYVEQRQFLICSLIGIITCLLWDFYINIKLQGIFVGTMLHLVCFLISYYYVREPRRR